MRIGITGHQELNDPRWVKQQILSVLKHQALPLVGLSSLAVGADQLFAEAVLELDGLLEAVVPFEGYEFTFESPMRICYTRLLHKAAKTWILENRGSRQEAYMAAGEFVVANSELLIAIWDGRPSAGLGGTADVVTCAQHAGRRLIHINPVTKITSKT
jgi:hypothetical protein